MDLYAENDDTWFGVGFNATHMVGTYAVVVQVEEGPTERILGFHDPGELLNSSFTTNEVSVVNGLRKVSVQSDYANNTNYNWEELLQGAIQGNQETFQIPMIWSKGQSSVFQFHGPHNFGNTSVMVFSTKGFQISGATDLSHMLVLWCCAALAVYVVLF